MITHVAVVHCDVGLGVVKGAQAFEAGGLLPPAAAPGFVTGAIAGTGDADGGDTIGAVLVGIKGCILGSTFFS